MRFIDTYYTLLYIYYKYNLWYMSHISFSTVIYNGWPNAQTMASDLGVIIFPTSSLLELALLASVPTKYYYYVDSILIKIY